MDRKLTKVELEKVENGYVVEAQFHTKDEDDEWDYETETFVFLDYGTAELKVRELFGEMNAESTATPEVTAAPETLAA